MFDYKQRATTREYHEGWDQAFKPAAKKPDNIPAGPTCDLCGIALQPGYRRCSDCEDRQGYHPAELGNTDVR